MRVAACVVDHVFSVKFRRSGVFAGDAWAGPRKLSKVRVQYKLQAMNQSHSSGFVPSTNAGQFQVKQATQTDLTYLTLLYSMRDEGFKRNLVVAFISFFRYAQFLSLGHPSSLSAGNRQAGWLASRPRYQYLQRHSIGRTISRDALPE